MNPTVSLFPSLTSLKPHEPQVIDSVFHIAGESLQWWGVLYKPRSEGLRLSQSKEEGEKCKRSGTFADLEEDRFHSRCPEEFEKSPRDLSAFTHSLSLWVSSLRLDLSKGLICLTGKKNKLPEARSCPETLKVSRGTTSGTEIIFLSLCTRTKPSLGDRIQEGIVPTLKTNFSFKVVSKLPGIKG